MAPKHRISHPGLQNDDSLISEVEERLRAMGQELHDNFGQQLAAIGYQAHALEKKLLASSSTELASIAASIASQAHDSVTQCKQFAQNLFPIELETSNLTDALEAFTSRIAKVYEITADFTSTGNIHINDASLALDLFRIAQEAANNAIRHGHARHLRIALESHGRLLRLSIVDDGCGLDHTVSDNAMPAGMGVKTMRYRAQRHGAKLEFIPLAAGGTEVRVELGI